MANSNPDKTDEIELPRAEEKTPFYNSLAFQIFAVFFGPLAACLYILHSTSENREAIRQAYSEIKVSRTQIRNAVQNLYARVSECENRLHRHLSTQSASERELFQSSWARAEAEIRVIEDFSSRVGDRPRPRKLTSELRKASQVFVSTSGAVLSGTSSDRMGEVIEARNLIATILQRFLAEAEIIESEQIEASEAKIDAEYTKTIYVALAVLLAAFAIVSVVALRIVFRIKTVAARCRAIADGNGDLTQRFHTLGSDELSVMTRYFDQFLDKTYHLVSTIAGSAGQVAKSATQLNRLATDTAKATENLRKNSALEQLSMDRCQIAVVKLQDGMKFTAERIQQTVNLATDSHDQAKQSAAHVADAFQKIQGVLEHTRRVGEHIGAIVQIANQTKVLSINAAIEAAKAGENGEGFYQVAEEIRQLSENAQRLTLELSEHFESSNRDVSAGSAIASTATEALSRMTGTINTIAAQVQEMGQTASAQTEVVNEVFEQVKILTSTIESSSQSTNNVARSSKQLTSEARGLNELTKTLNQSVSQFNLTPRDDSPEGPEVHVHGTSDDNASAA